MKKYLKTTIFAAIFFFSLSACTLTLPIAATSHPVPGTKEGRAKASSIFGLTFDQDASIKKAAAAGGITEISTVDLKTTNILFIFITYETIVTGE